MLKKTNDMLKKLLLFCVLFIPAKNILFAQQGEMLVYHAIQTDKDGIIIPWYNPDPAIAFDHNLMQIWNFWDTMRRDMNGLPYYMNHQVWNGNFDDPRGIGGDQFMMALSSWRLLYAYTGNERIKENMSFLAGYYLTHGLSPANCKFPDIPFPYNTLIYSGIYDGDMRNGKDVAQLDKAGSFGLELIHMYKIKNDSVFRDAAVKIANTLAANVKTGDAQHSPLPFKVNVYTGKTAYLKTHDRDGKWTDTACYTSNLTPTLQMFDELIELNKGNVTAYKAAFNKILAWLKKYPVQDNVWGPFFEDVDWWSETQINAMTCARYMMEHPQYFPEWKMQVKNIINWVHKNFANDKWKKYGVVVTNEQTIYQTPANSHSSRQASDELLYSYLSGDTSLYTNAVRELIWAGYMVDFDGKNCFPYDEPWLTDGYGDYVRHFLRAMATYPQLAPAADHILSSTSVIQQADYKGYIKKFLVPDFDNVDTNNVRLFYRCFNTSGIETVRMKSKPSVVLLNNKPMPEAGSGEGYSWRVLDKGGVLTVRRQNGDRVIVMQ
jgi:hypothetical protein